MHVSRCRHATSAPTERIPLLSQSDIVLFHFSLKDGFFFDFFVGRTDEARLAIPAGLCVRYSCRPFRELNDDSRRPDVAHPLSDAALPTQTRLDHHAGFCIFPMHDESIGFILISQRRPFRMASVRGDFFLFF